MNRLTLSYALVACMAAATLPAGSAFAQMKAPEGMLTPAPGAAGAPSAPSGAPSAPQQQDPMTSEFRDCVKKTKEAMDAKKQQDFPAIYNCLSAEVKRQENRLTASVTRSSKFLSATEKTSLDAANTAWRRFRDANCAFYADPKLPPPANLENADCQLNLTIGRLQELEMVAQNASRRAEAKAAAPKDGK